MRITFSINSKTAALSLAAVSLVTLVGSARADSSSSSRPSGQPTVVARWNAAALQGVRDSKLGPPMVARALAIVHTCIFDAWSAYAARVIPTRTSAVMRPPQRESTDANKTKAISYAAYRALSDLMPADIATVYDPLMRSLGFDPTDTSQDVTEPQGIGNVACAAVLEYRHHDGSNQLGDLHPGAYSDYTGYLPVNAPSMVPVDPAMVSDVARWQPLQYYDLAGNFVTQSYAGPFWNKVAPFALSSASQFRPSPPVASNTPAFVAQARELIDVSANLTDRQKMIAEYWANGPRTELPPGHWNLFAQFVSIRDHQGIDDDAMMFFALTNAIFDAGIAAWDAKIAYDSVRPVTAIAVLFAGDRIRSWGGPSQGTVEMDGAEWRPYQPASFPTPPFAEYVSGHSAFSAAGAEILRSWTGADSFGGSVSFLPGSSIIEPGTVPSEPLTLNWQTFTAAADEAGVSRVYGGIHFNDGDLNGRRLGRLVGEVAWYKACEHFRVHRRCHKERD